MDPQEFKKKNDLSILLTKIRILSMMTFKFFCDHPDIKDQIVLDTLSQAYFDVNKLIDGLIEISHKPNLTNYQNDEWSPQEVAFIESLNTSDNENEIDQLHASNGFEENFRFKDGVDNDGFKYKTVMDPDYIYDLTEMHKRALANPPKNGKEWRQLPTVIHFRT